MRTAADGRSWRNRVFTTEVVVVEPCEREEEDGAFLLSLSAEGSPRFGRSTECVSIDAHRGWRRPVEATAGNGICKQRRASATALQATASTSDGTYKRRSSIALLGHAVMKPAVAAMALRAACRGIQVTDFKQTCNSRTSAFPAF